MRESFLLKFYGNYSIIEQNFMTAEERAWNLKAIDQENKRSNGRDQGGPPGKLPARKS